MGIRHFLKKKKRRKKKKEVELEKRVEVGCATVCVCGWVGVKWSQKEAEELGRVCAEP